MKKLILALLLTSLVSYAQTINLDLTIRNIIPVDFSFHQTEATAIIIPENKICMIQGEQMYVFVRPTGFNLVKSFNVGNGTFLTGGTKVWVNTTEVITSLYNIIEFNVPSTQTGTLVLNEIKDINNKIELFPNPTNSKIALNSEKNYTIEVYDMQGQIVMKDKGNTIDLSNLSNAVYILKAYDNYEKTTTSYKVVKK